MAGKMPNEQRAILAARNVAGVLKALGGNHHMFEGVGPEENGEFMQTHLPNSTMQPEELTQLAAKIDEAANNKDMKTINAILGTVTSLIGPLKTVFGLGII